MTLKLITAFACALISGYLVLLLRSYEYLTRSELKRQARSGNRHAQAVYRVRGPYGSHIYVLLWSLIGFFSSVMIILLESAIWSGVAIAIAIVVTVSLHAILPWSKYPSPSLGLAAFTAPFLAQVIRFLAPLFLIIEKLSGAWFSRSEINRVHSKDELLEILEHTTIGGDPFSKDELQIAIHALTFGDKKIGEVMTPRSVVRSVKVGDIISPVLLGELHESGYSRFPVVETDKGDYVGILYVKDLTDIRTNVMVKDVMRTDINFVNEFSSLDNVLNAFLRTKHHLFFVVNEFEDVVGIITIEDVIEQIIGRKIIDEFDQYEDLRVVAAQLATARSEQRNHDS